MQWDKERGFLSRENGVRRLDGRKRKIKARTKKAQEDHSCPMEEKSEGYFPPYLRFHLSRPQEKKCRSSSDFEVPVKDTERARE